jgi:hypothetical protein
MAVSEYSAYLVDWPVCSRDRNGEAIDFVTKSDRVVVRLLNAADRRKISALHARARSAGSQAHFFAFNPAVPNRSRARRQPRTQPSIAASRPAAVPVCHTLA